jgi:DNA polymerase III subunit delta
VAYGKEPPRDVLGELRRGEIAPVYCLYGKERFLLGRALDALRAAVLEPATRDFNHDVLDAKAGAAAIVAAARTLPMMAKRRLVVVRGADEIKADATEPLLAYVADPAPETVLVLLCEKVDARQKLFAALKKKGALCAFDPPRDRELYSFIVAEARSRGGGIEESAARLLAEIVGPDLGQLAQAVEKLVL